MGAEQVREKTRIFNLQIRQRERQHRRRRSLTEERSTISRMGDHLRGREVWCNQENSTFFSKLPAELRLKIYSLVLNEEDLLRICTDIKRAKFQIGNSFLEDNPDLFADTEDPRTLKDGDVLVQSADPFATLYKDYNYERDRRPGASLLSLLLTCRRA